MLEAISGGVKPQKGLGDLLEVRAALLVRGRTLKSFARKHGVTIELVRQVITGRCPGKMGKACEIRAELIKVLQSTPSPVKTTLYHYDRN